MKRIVTLVLVTLMALLSLSAFAEGTVNKDISGYIEVGGWPSGDDAFKAAMAGFNEMYPNIEVELVFTDTTAYHQAL